MFTGFTDETVDFMWGIRFNNERTWFEAHKDIYLTHFYQPMRELGDELYDYIAAKRPDLGLIRKVTRIYRDVRRLHGRGPYKESLWFSVEQPAEEWTAHPTFWFELMPEGWTCGMGYYMPKPVTMAKLRARIDRDPDTMEKLMRRLRRQKEFALETEDYKRPRAPAPSKLLEPWYRARSFTICHNDKLTDELFSREIVGRLFSDMARLDFTTPAFEESQLLMGLDGYAGRRSIFSGATNVQPLLRMVLSQELTRTDARVELTVPPTDTFLSGELLRRYLDGRMGAEVSQIIAFDASGAAEDINLHNLECFCRVLPISLLSKRHYHPYYYYDNSVAARYTDPFPYFLVTHSCVVCLSEGGGQVMLLRSPDQVACYHRHFPLLQPDPVYNRPGRDTGHLRRLYGRGRVLHGDGSAVLRPVLRRPHDRQLPAA